MGEFVEKTPREDDSSASASKEQKEQVSAEKKGLRIRAERDDEDLDDAKHSKNNTEKLNIAYSSLLNFFFSNRLVFWFWAILIFCLYLLVGMEKFLPSRICWNADLLFHIAQKTLNVLLYIAFALLAFPTAKGVRRFLRELINFLFKKANKRF